MRIRCPRSYCGGEVEEFVNSEGGGSRYCLDGCGYYEELPVGSFRRPQPERADPPRRRPPPKKRF